MQVVYQQQKHIILHLFNVLCLGYASRLYHGSNRIHIDDLVDDVIRLRIFLKQMEAPLTKDLLADQLETLRSDALETIRIHSNTLMLGDADDGSIQQIHVSMEHLAREVDIGKMKAHPLQPLTMAIAVPSLSLQLYINPCLFWLARPAYLLVAALKLQREQHFLGQLSIKDQLKKYAYELEDIFKYEFIIDASRQEEVNLLSSHQILLT